MRKSPQKFNALGSKMGNTLHTRLRLYSTSLNSHLFQIQKASSPSCECGHPNENLAHFVLTCPRFDMLRSKRFHQTTNAVPGFPRLTNQNKLKMLLHGHNLNNDDGVKVVQYFQTLLIQNHSFPIRLTCGRRRDWPGAHPEFSQEVGRISFPCTVASRVRKINFT